MKFTKMHGLGNDYVYINCFEENVPEPEALAIQVSDRHFGIGSDGLILICPSDIADAKMRMFNADGSESKMCGNGLRCVAKYTFDHKLADSNEHYAVPGETTFPASLRFETGNGILRVGIMPGDDGKADKICVNMGQPSILPTEIPVIADVSVINKQLEVSGIAYMMTCVSMGNPHVIFFCDDPYNIELEKIGPIIECTDIFPERINVHFVKIDGPNEFTMRTWERGSGITLACGTGACACLVAAVLNGKTERSTLAHLPGGDLNLSWCKDDNCVYMTGPATEVFTGEWA